MKSILLSQLQQENVLIIRGIKVSQCFDNNRYLFAANVQCSGGQVFEWLTHSCASIDQIMMLFGRLMQVHVWNAPEDIEKLGRWRKSLEQWIVDHVAEQAITLDIEDTSIKPLMLDFVYLKSR